jgi:crossover junction endodeoxyribonuclease RuvC
MKILGIDPGIDRCGYGLIDDGSGELVAPAYGVIHTDGEIDGKKQSDASRLVIIGSDFRQLLRELKPDELAIEIFVPSPAIAHQAPKVLQARGVILLLAQQVGLPIAEYYPATIKAAVVDGRAKKREVQEAVTEILGLPGIPQPDDAADALAIAYTHHGARRCGMA